MADDSSVKGDPPDWNFKKRSSPSFPESFEKKPKIGLAFRKFLGIINKNSVEWRGALPSQVPKELFLTKSSGRKQEKRAVVKKTVDNKNRLDYDNSSPQKRDSGPRKEPVDKENGPDYDKTLLSEKRETTNLPSSYLEN
jgi:hypothetical protein